MKDKNKTNDNDRGRNLVLQIDKLLSERNIKRQPLCDSVGITLQAISNWKKQNSLPNTETVIKIADFFKVDPKWLVTGQIDLPKNEKSEPSKIFDRVYHLLLEETDIPDPDYHKITGQQAEALWKPVENIVSYYDLLNWQFDRIMPTYRQIFDLAEHFGKPITFIAEGIDEVPDYLNPWTVPENEYKDFKRFEAHKDFMYKFHNLSKDGMKVVDSLVDYLFNKEHKR